MHTWFENGSSAVHDNRIGMVDSNQSADSRMTKTLAWLSTFEVQMSDEHAGPYHALQLYWEGSQLQFCKPPSLTSSNFPVPCTWPFRSGLPLSSNLTNQHDASLLLSPQVTHANFYLALRVSLFTSLLSDRHLNAKD